MDEVVVRLWGDLWGDGGRHMEIRGGYFGVLGNSSAVKRVERCVPYVGVVVLAVLVVAAFHVVW